MSLLLDSYRRNAEAARAEAEQTALPKVRARALEASARWTEMAERLEWVEEQARQRSQTARVSARGQLSP